MGYRLIGLNALGLMLLLAGCRASGSGGALEQFRGELGRFEAVQDAALVTAPQGPNPAEEGDWLGRSSGDWRNPYDLRLASYQPGQDTSGSQTASQRRGGKGSRQSTPLPSLWATIQRDLQEMPSNLWADTKAVYGSPRNLVILGLAYGGSLAVQETGPDDSVEDSFDDGHRTFKHDWLDAFGAIGNPGTHFALAGLWYLVGQQAQDEKTYKVSKTLFSALMINGLSTLVGQAASWDDSPNGEWGTFPSGHTSSSFTFASVMHQAYGHWVGAPLYALSALVAYERLESKEHYLSDVLMGGVMGLVIGHTVSGEHEISLWGGRIEPFIDPASGTSGLAWVKHFK